ncbi:S9 family peptidase [Salinimicrobium tongyeongense]|uniref:S9 family peptidase n=1 Tax=Salinimicrobium tongyeongense TaxID=2809707 RepID=A0ABY6NT47_9FLAO|nr:S9 family peptidase [Salinimicrobium tongyeongense]UZH56082.1 S9 family peptidase [Salinimicrobium tongyeongense]
MKGKLTILLLLITQCIVAQQNVLTPQDVAKLEYVTSAVIAPEGDRIIYQKVVPADPLQKNVPASTHLYVYDVKSQTSTPLVTEYSTSNLRYRPGQNSITFLTRQKGDSATSLYEIPVGGGTPQKIFEFESSISSYDWHPQGQKLVFTSRVTGDDEKSGLPYEPEIYETNLTNSSAFVADLSGGQPDKLQVEGNVTGAQWSPDGTKLAVSAAPSSLVDDFYTSQKIYIVNPQSLDVTAQVEHKAKLGALKWSPNSEKIAFIAGKDENDPIDGRIFIVKATGGSPQILQQDFKGMFHDLDWRDNKTLSFLASEGVYSSLGTLKLDGKMQKLYSDNNVNVTSFSQNAKNEIAFVGNTAQHPGELFLLKKANADAKKLTDSNPWLKDETFGEQEVITYKAADGLEIQGILIHPVNNSGKKPLITVVHGGPEAHYDNGWLTNYSMPGQVGAGDGYAVFYPNYRGSTGRGVEFAISSQGDPGGKEFDDIIDGIDYLIENQNVDEDRVGVTGGSYGGYATAWMSTRHTGRFAAGVMSVGISNNISKWGTSDIPEEMFLVHSRKRIWDDYQFFLERSPIFYADQAKTPLLILHGKEDTRVDPGQSYELYRHIKTRTDTPVRLVLYPGEGHGNRNSTARYDFNLRMMRWFNTYLKNKDSEMPETHLAPAGK